MCDIRSNIDLIKKFILKNYRITNVNISYVVKYNMFAYKLYDLETNENVNEWAAMDYMQKIFSVDVVTVKTAMREVVLDSIEQGDVFEDLNE